MIVFEYLIEKCMGGYLIDTRLKSNGQTVMVGEGVYTTRWSAHRGIRRIIKLLDKEVKVVNVGMQCWQ